MNPQNNKKFVKLTLGQRFTLAWGKLRRAYLVYLRPKYTAYLLARREGVCKRCGACCRLLFDCQHWIKNSSPAECRIYLRRSHVCRSFPINIKDLRDRSLVRPDFPCGFSFKPNSITPNT